MFCNIIQLHFSENYLKLILVEFEIDFGLTASTYFYFFLKYQLVSTFLFLNKINSLQLVQQIIIQSNRISIIIILKLHL